MSVDTTYKNFPFIFKSTGLSARVANDQIPQHSFIDLNNCEERQEDTISSRFGSIIINRDGDLYGTQNYLLPSAPTTLSRLKGLDGSTYRYAGLANGNLYRRTGDSQGQYLPIATGLSGQQFSSVVSNCFLSSLPYLFIADKRRMLKDSGTGNPTQWGVFPPQYVCSAFIVGISDTRIETFQSASGFTVSGLSITGISTFATVNGTAGVVQLNLTHYQCPDASDIGTLSGMLSVATSSSALQIITEIAADASTFAIAHQTGSSTPIDTFTFHSVNGTVGSNTTATIGKTVALDLSNYEDDDLFVLVVRIDSPAAVQEVRIQFDVNSSGYTSDYYYKSISPASYQSGISLPQTSSPEQTVSQAVYSRASGATDLNQIGKPYTNITPDDYPAINRLQPTNLTTGDGSWSVIYLRKGEFLPVGNAGEPGLGWANITGWQIQITTNTQGSSGFGLNALYIQGGFGPSSFGGVGFDYRYTFYNATTGDESNGSGEQYFDTTSGSSDLIPLRQQIAIYGQYSPDPQNTQVRVYRRGGTLSANWVMVDKFPNIVGTGTFKYLDGFSDAQLLQASTLSLTNDVPVTSTLQIPINTVTTGAITPPTIGLAPVPVTIVHVIDGSVFVPYQRVVIGNPDNLEQVYVVTGGVGQFSACVQLPHAAGEPVQAFSRPAQPCYLAAIAYGKIFLAGDPNNPNALYYSQAGRPSSYSSADYILVGSPGDPIIAVINFRGNLYVATLTTWFPIMPGSPPYAQPSGSKHGIVAPFGWTQTESAIIYQSVDGIRQFRGADGLYMSLPIEWLYRLVPQSYTPVTLVNLKQLAGVTMAFQNNVIYAVYPGVDGVNHRIMSNTSYGNRWRNDGVNATAIYLEEDTNTLLYAKAITIGEAAGYVIVQDRVGDIDDAGWVDGQLTSTPIDMRAQTPYLDQGAPDNPKQYNDLTIDANPKGQTIGLRLLFDDNNGDVVPVVPDPPTFTGKIRDKFQFTIAAGLGQQAYRVSLEMTSAVVKGDGSVDSGAPLIYQADIGAAVLPEERSSYDSYWFKFGTDESKLIKQGWFDYTASGPLEVSVYADGNKAPYYVFTLPGNPDRADVPLRVRFPARKVRMLRIVILGDDVATSFQLWSALQVDTKPIVSGKGYSRSEVPAA